MQDTLQEQLFQLGVVTKEQRDRALEGIERKRRIAENNARHHDRLETIANSLSLNQEFINHFMSRSNKKMTILGELSKSKQGKGPKCTVCKQEGMHYPASEGRDNPKTTVELYKFFNLCTRCFPPDTYHARLGMAPAKKRDHYGRHRV